MSGSFAPNLGVTYDQQSVPSSPSRGQTWRERNSSNDIIQTWFWNGAVWLSANPIPLFEHRFRSTTGVFGTDLTFTASNTAGSPGRLFFPIPVALGKSIFVELFFFNTDNVSGDWTVSLVPVNMAGAIGTALPNSSLAPIATGTNYTQSINTVITKNTATNYTLFLRAVLNSSGSLRLTDYGITIREVY